MASDRRSDASTPTVVVLSGPNGAGKTTSAPLLLRGALSVHEFVNADAVASGLSAFHPERVAFEAGRAMLRRLRELGDRRSSFAFETTLASRTLTPRLRGLLGKGYALHLIYLWLRSPDLAVERVAGRVLAGGHSVPDLVIRRRYRSGLRNLFELYIPLATSWRLYDNSTGVPVLVARGRREESPIVIDAAGWEGVRRAARNA